MPLATVADSQPQRGGPKIDPSLLRLDRTDLPIPRKGFATMQINSFTAENLTAALTEAKVRIPFHTYSTIILCMRICTYVCMGIFFTLNYLYRLTI